jgi:hypothetical protein
MKFNLVGTTFSYTDSWAGPNYGYSAHGKVAKKLEWTQNGTGEGTFYIDRAIAQGLHQQNNKPKYGWLLESKSITPEIVNEVLNNWEKYLEAYDVIFTHDKLLLDKDSRFKFVPGQGSWIKEPKIYDKTKMTSMITSSKQMVPGHNVRLAWVEKLRANLDLYGRTFNFIQNKEEGLCDYMFSVAIENTIYETYFTEKILDCFMTGTVPIYLGTPDIGNYYNTDGIIILTDDFDITSLSEELYYSKMSAIKDNFERVKKMDVLEDFIIDEYFS